MLVKLIPYLAALVLMVLSYLYVHHLGYVTGKAVAQVQIDAFVKKQADLGIKAHLDALAKEVAARKENAKALANYQRQLSNSHVYIDWLVERLRPYLNSGSGGVPQGKDRPGSADPGQTPSPTGIGEAIGNALAECRGNDAQLDTLRDELIPQL